MRKLRPGLGNCSDSRGQVQEQKHEDSRTKRSNQLFDQMRDKLSSWFWKFSDGSFCRQLITIYDVGSFPMSLVDATQLLECDISKHPIVFAHHQQVLKEKIFSTR